MEPGADEQRAGRRHEVAARGDVASAVEAVSAAARDAGLTVFAQVDHAAGARAAGLELADEVLLLVGAPRVGTALMQAEPRVGLDLPLHILVWDDGGTTRMTWRDPRALASEHGLTGLDPVLDAMAAGLAKVTAAAAAG